MAMASPWSTRMVLLCVSSEEYDDSGALGGGGRG